jgi:hypothetical protein
MNCGFVGLLLVTQNWVMHSESDSMKDEANIVLLSWSVLSAVSTFSWICTNFNGTTLFPCEPNLNPYWNLYFRATRLLLLWPVSVMTGHASWVIHGSEIHHQNYLKLPQEVPNTCQGLLSTESILYRRKDNRYVWGHFQVQELPKDPALQEPHRLNKTLTPVLAHAARRIDDNSFTCMLN